MIPILIGFGFTIALSILWSEIRRVRAPRAVPADKEPPLPRIPRGRDKWCRRAVTHAVCAPPRMWPIPSESGEIPIPLLRRIDDDAFSSDELRIKQALLALEDDPEPDTIRAFVDELVETRVNVPRPPLSFSDLEETLAS